jgi:hypothetical protein
MAPWAILEFALALAFTVGGLALIIGELHMIERAEAQEWLKHLKESV